MFSSAFSSRQALRVRNRRSYSSSLLRGELLVNEEEEEEKVEEN